MIYVPILRGKEGEFAALEALEPDVRKLIKPLVEVPGVPFDYANERPARTLQEHVQGIAARLCKCWGGQPLYIHMPYFEDSGKLNDGRTALESVLADCKELGVAASPVVSSSSSAAYLAAAAAHVNSAKVPACLRLSVEDFEEDRDPDEIIVGIVDQIGTYSDIDLIVDLEHIGTDAARAVLVARSLMGMVPSLPQWRCVIVASASFPVDLSEVSRDSVSVLQRSEVALWRALQKRPVKQRSDLVFADYGISHPEPTELDPRTMRMSASIRYTTEEGWLVLKGSNVRQFGFEQYFDLCRDLVQRKEYSGPEYSWGDFFINQCALRTAGPGNATTWRKVGTNHHVTLLARQLEAEVAAIPKAGA
jgi:hypothetical protein